MNRTFSWVVPHNRRARTCKHGVSQKTTPKTTGLQVRPTAPKVLAQLPDVARPHLAASRGSSTTEGQPEPCAGRAGQQQPGRAAPAGLRPRVEAGASPGVRGRQGLGHTSSAMRGQGAVLWCCCLAACLASAAQGRRELLITDQQAQSALDTVFSSAGDIVGQAQQALQSSSLAEDNTATPWQKNHTIEAVNERAPAWETSLNYSIRPQVASALHNAEMGWGPVRASSLWEAGAPAPAPAAEAPAVAAESGPRWDGGRRLLQYAAAPAADPAVSSAVFAPLAAPGAGVAGGAALDLAQMQHGAAAAGPSMQFQSLRKYGAAAQAPSMQSQSLQHQDDHLYTSYAAKKTKITPDTLSQWGAAAAPAQVSSSTAQAAQATYPAQQGASDFSASTPVQHAGTFWDPQQGAYSSASSSPRQQAAQATPSTYSAQQGVSSAAPSLPAQQQGTGTKSAYTAQQGVYSAASGGPVQQTQQVTPSAYQATQQGAWNAGPSQGASPAQGTLDMGSSVPSAAAAQDASSAAAASLAAAKHAKAHKAAAQLAQGQGQVNQGPAAAAPGASPANGAAGTVKATWPNPVTLSNGGLQPKSDQGGVSLDPNQPNRLPGMVRQAQIIQQQQEGYSPPVTPTSATQGTAFAGTPVQNLPGPLQVTATSPLDGPAVSGSEISLVVGTRIATPFFGTGFNFCVDRYFGSFPKVGIVIPNIAQWLLPELQDLAKTLETTLQLPPDATIGHGLTLEPTGDGILISLPTVQPNNIPDVGIRYGIQIGQAFGYDFGFGIIRDICFITFVTV